jgi:hypothetical protein
MIRYLVGFVFFCGLVFPLSAQWVQLLLPEDEGIYEVIESLSRESGVPLFPEGTHRPWSYSSTFEQLDRIDYARLSDEGKVLYKQIRNSLAKESLYEEDNLAFDMEVVFSPALFNNFTFMGTPLSYGELVYGTKKRPALLELPFQYSFYNNFVMEAKFNFVEEPVEDDKDLNITNIPLDTYEIDWNVPQRAYVALGADNWSVLLGRIQNDWGHGYVGNSFLSGSLAFHESLRAQAFWKSFGYSFLFITLENRLSGEQEDKLQALEPLSGGEQYKDNAMKGGKYLITHSLDFILFEGVHIGLTEGLIFGGYDFDLNPTFFNPMELFHNWFTNIPGQGNAIHQVEVDYTWKNNLVYVQSVLDQFQAPTEVAMGYDAPFTFGVLTGFKRSGYAGKGNLTLGGEVLWMSPYVYTNTNGTYYRAATGNEYHLSGIINLPIGFYEGPDRLVFSLYGMYKEFQRQELEVELRYSLRGPVTMNDEYPWEPIAGIDTGRLTPSFLSDEQEIRLDISYGRYVTDNLSLKLWGVPLYQFMRRDGEPDTFSLETGVTLSWEL